MNQKNLLLLLLLVATVVACNPAEKYITAPHLVATGSAALHAIDSNELRQVMGRMNGLMFERNLTDQELDRQRHQALSQVIEAADGVEQAITAILATQPRLNLDAGEQKVFLALAVRLGEEAKTLKIQAVTHQDEQIPATLEKISTTCNACHQLFRDFGKHTVQP